MRGPNRGGAPAGLRSGRSGRIHPAAPQFALAPENPNSVFSTYIYALVKRSEVAALLAEEGDPNPPESTEPRRARP